MITFTKEQLIASAHARIEFAEMMLAGELEPLKERAWSIELELARIALASLEAEAVITVGDDGGDALAYRRLIQTFAPGTKLYTAPPAPVSVPDEHYQNLSELYHAQEKRLFKLVQRIKGPSFDKYAYSPSQAIDVLESAIFGEREEDFRAAMLQGAEPVTTANKLRDAVEIIRSSGIEIDAEKILAERDALNSPVIPDGWVACNERMPEQFVEVLACTEDGGRYIAALNQRMTWDDGDFFDDIQDVTHWQPLPSPPAK